MSRIPQAVIDEVVERSKGLCENAEMCGLPVNLGRPGAHFHHRQARAMGGSKGRNLDVAANLMLVHSACHSYIHGNPAWSRGMGYIVSQYAETPS